MRKRSCSFTINGMLFLSLYAKMLITFCLSLEGPTVVSFPSANVKLQGTLFKPNGSGPFPALVYMHGSAKENATFAKNFGPYFANRGWVFFMPDRRGHGMSNSAGPYIMDEIDKAAKRGKNAASMAMIRLLSTDHLDDQVAAVEWLRKQSFVNPKQVAVHGSSFGGILTILGAERINYCAAIDLAGATLQWNDSQDLQNLLMAAASRIKVPVFFIQADNDFTVMPTRVLSNVMRKYQKPFQLKMYPPVGRSPAEAHTFAQSGISTWGGEVVKFLDKHCLQGAIRTEVGVE